MPTVWAKIKDGKVLNLQMCTNDDVKDPDFVWVDLGANENCVEIGWNYDGQNFTQNS